MLIQLVHEEGIRRAIVFTRTKHGANRLAGQLEKADIDAEAIHGNKSQPQREKAMKAFKRGDLGVLVATDIAARGIDVDELSHVINFEIPNIPETYVHRIGRTGRAGAEGIAISFCNEEDERTYLRDIQRLIRKEVPLDTDQDYHNPMPPIPLDSGRPGGQGPGKNKTGRNRKGHGGQGKRRRPQGGQGGPGGGGPRGRHGQGGGNKRRKGPRNGGNGGGGNRPTGGA